LAVSDVVGMDIERSRADEVMWAMYKQGWKDAHATVIAALASVPSSPPVDLRPAVVRSGRSQMSTDSVASVYRQPTVDSRPMATGPVRIKARVYRNARRRNVSTRPPKLQEKSTASTPRVRSC
jgi:hypothetical protein